MLTNQQDSLASCACNYYTHQVCPRLYAPSKPHCTAEYQSIMGGQHGGAKLAELVLPQISLSMLRSSAIECWLP